MSTNIIDRPPTIGAPPPPPPSVRKRGGGSGSGTVIIPCPGHAMLHTLHPCEENNWMTVIHYWMIRVELETMEAIGHEHICTRTYRQWLADLEHQYPDLPPHVSFGGRITTGEPDEQLFANWKAYATRKYAW